MPYEAKTKLPHSVRENLPAHAREIYKEAVNNAWDEYKHDEERAHRVAWGAVKKASPGRSVRRMEIGRLDRLIPNPTERHFRRSRRSMNPAVLYGKCAERSIDDQRGRC